MVVGMRRGRQLGCALLSSILLVLYPAIVRFIFGGLATVLGWWIGVGRPPMGVGGGHTAFSCRLVSACATNVMLANARVGSVHLKGTDLMSAFYCFIGNRL